MLITDDQRRLVTGNRAACAMLGIARDEVSWLTMDRVTPASERRRLQKQWATFLTAGAAAGSYTLEVANQEPVRVEFGATANVLPSRHLMVFVAPGEASDEPRDLGEPWAPVALDLRGRHELTEREREIMTLVATGVQSGEIAKRLYLSTETVKSHVQNAMGKLGSHTRAHAVATALVTGQITWDP